MMWFWLSLVAVLFWSGSDFFSKLGSPANDKNSHWKMVMAVGLFMGAHATVELMRGTPFTLRDILVYLPVSALYIIAMIFGYVGLRHIELSISTPICNSSGAVAAVLMFLFLRESLTAIQWVAVVLIVVAIDLLTLLEGGDFHDSVQDHSLILRQTLHQVQEGRAASDKEDEAANAAEGEGRNAVSGDFDATDARPAPRESSPCPKRGALRARRSDRHHMSPDRIPALAILFSILYCIIDGLGTFADAFVLDSYITEDSANIAYEYTFFILGVIAFFYVRFYKGEHIIVRREGAKLLAGACETVGQYAYIFALGDNAIASAPLISSYCVFSVLWARLFLKEKLTWKQYGVVLLAVIGIIILGAEGE